MTACEAGSLEIIEHILESNNDLINFKGENGSPLHAAISGKDSLKTINLLLPYYKDVLVAVNEPDLVGVRPLYLAVYCGSHDLTELLLFRGADSKLATLSNVTLLHICAERGFSTIARLLLNKGGAKQLIYLADQDGNTPMHVAAEWDHIDLVKIFVETGGEEME